MPHKIGISLTSGHAMDMTIGSGRRDSGRLNFDASSLDSLYRGRLVELRELAESRNISKGFCRGTQSQN